MNVDASFRALAEAQIRSAHWTTESRWPDTDCMFTSIKTLLLTLLVFAALAFGRQAQNPFPQTASTLAASAASAKNRLKIALILTDNAVMIDFAGPWEVFQDVMILPKGVSMHDKGVNMHDIHPLELYTVSDSRKPVRVSGGMQITPDYSSDDAPQPNVIVIPAQSGDSPKMMEWIRKMATHSDVIMSVCTGAFTLAETGLLNGKKATTSSRFLGTAPRSISRDHS